MKHHTTPTPRKVRKKKILGAQGRQPQAKRRNGHVRRRARQVVEAIGAARDRGRGARGLDDEGGRDGGDDCREEGGGSPLPLEVCEVEEGLEWCHFYLYLFIFLRFSPSLSLFHLCIVFVFFSKLGE